MLGMVKGLALKYAMPGILVAVVLLVAALGWQTLRLGWAQSSLSKAKEVHATYVANAERAAREQETRYRQLERNYIEGKERADARLRQEQASHRRIADAFRAAHDGLRGDIAAFAAGSRRTEDSLAACRDDAATLGELLGGSLRAEEELAGAAEEHAASTRALLDAWPRQSMTAE